MKITPACRLCLERLIKQASELATEDPRIQEEARMRGMAVLERRFINQTVSTVIASEVHRVIRNVTGNPDPYIKMKEKEIKIARVISTALCDENTDPDSCIHTAIRGNSIDFFVDEKTIVQGLNSPVLLAKNDVARLKKMISGAHKVLYLADNAGECFFDLPLVKVLCAVAETSYVVKGSPVQNDITIKELETAGLKDRIGRVITTGNDFVGLDLATASTEFQREYRKANLIIAKGMGHYETITEMKPEGRVAFLLKAKCQPVADSLDVPLDSCVVKVY